MRASFRGQEMGDEGLDFISTQRSKMIFHQYSLIERFEDGSDEAIVEVWLSGNDEDSGINRVHLEVGKYLKFDKIFVFEQMGFIEDKDGGDFTVYGKIANSGLDGVKEARFEMEDVAAEGDIKLAVEVEHIDRREGDVKGFIGDLREFVSEEPKSSGFSDAGVTGEEHDATVGLQVFETSEEFVHAF